MGYPADISYLSRNKGLDRNCTSTYYLVGSVPIKKGVRVYADNIRLDSSWTTKEDRSTTNVAKIGELIKHDVNFAVDQAGRLHYYNNGVYKPEGDQVVSELYVQWLQECNCIEDWRAGKGAQLVEYIKINAPLLRDKPPLGVVNLRNGLFDWNKQKLFKHNPKYLSTIQIPVTYDPEASGTAWTEFLQTVLPFKGGATYLKEIIASCLVPFTGLQKCIVLVGTGSNGKSTFLNGMQEIIGLDNISNIPLHTLTNPLEKFARAGLVGKLVNIFGDMSTKKIEDAANFKPLVGEDRIPIEYKHKDAYYYTPFCKLIFSCNEVVRSDDDSDGYKRRFIHIPFTQRFKVDPQKGLDLKQTLSDSYQLSSVLNDLLALIPKVLSTGFTLTPEIAGIIDEWCPIPEETKQFLLSTLEPDINSSIPISAFYNYHTSHCPTVEPFERAKLVRYLKHLFPDIELNKTARLSGRVVRVHKGVRAKNERIRMEILDEIDVDVVETNAEYLN